MVSAGNGKATRVLEQIVEEVQERGGESLERASKAVRDADVSEKLDRLLDFVEGNATVIAALAKRFAGEAGATARSAGATAAEAVGQAAEAGLEAAGDAIESIGDAIDEEVIRPTMRYGRGLRHGLLLGAILAFLFTPWPGNVAREKLTAFGREAKDLVDALREGASAGPDEAGGLR